MPPHATPQRPRSETQTCPAVPAVLSIREEAALLRAAQAAGAISVTETTPEQLDAFFARRRAEALKTAEERWSLSFTEQGEPVPVEGGDWQWSIERQTDGAQAGACDDKTSAEAPLSPDSRTLARSHERPAETAACVAGSPAVKPKRRAAEAADTPCGAATRQQQRRLHADADVAPPTLKAFFPAR